MYITLTVLVLMIALFILNKIPMAVSAMLGMLALVITKTISPEQAINCICNNTTLTITSMFILSSALSKTELMEKISRFGERASGNSLRKIIFSYTAVTFIMVQFIPSITAVFALICPLVISMCRKMNINPSKVLYSIGLVAVVTAFTLTPIGPYAANFVENNGYQIKYGIEGFINTPFTEMILKFPPTIVAIIWAVFFAPNFAPDIKTDSDKILNRQTKAFKNQLKPYQNKVTVILFGLVIITLIVQPFNLPTWVIPAICACLVVALGIISEKETFSSMGINIILIYAGVSSLGVAFNTTGTGSLIGNAILEILGNTRNSYVLGFAFFITSFVLTNLIYNRAVGKILIPIVLSTAATLGCDPRGLVQMCYIGSMCSLLTPMATSIVPMMTESAGYSQKDLLKMGIIPSVLLCLTTVLCGMTLYPCF